MAALTPSPHTPTSPGPPNATLLPRTSPEVGLCRLPGVLFLESKKNADCRNPVLAFSHSAENALPLDEFFLRADRRRLAISNIQSEPSRKRVAEEDESGVSGQEARERDLGIPESWYQELELQENLTGYVYRVLNSKGSKSEILHSLSQGLNRLQEFESNFISGEVGEDANPSRLNHVTLLNKIQHSRQKLITLFNQNANSFKAIESTSIDSNEHRSFIASIKELRRDIFLIKNDMKNINGDKPNQEYNFNTSSSSTFSSASVPSLFSLFSLDKAPLKIHPPIHDPKDARILDDYGDEASKRNKNSNVIKIVLGLAFIGASAAISKTKIMPLVNSSSSEIHAQLANPLDEIEVDETLPLYQKALPGVLELSSENFYSRVHLRPTFIMFYAVWCPYCEQLSSTWKELALAMPEYGFNVQIAQVNGEYNPHLLNYFDVRGFPTLILVDGDEVLGSHKGPRDLQSLIAFLDTTLPS